MAERQVSIGKRTYPLPNLFMVMATQNPLEQEGTYPLPEAQLDRFLMHINIDYPDANAELSILRLVREENRTQEASCPDVIAQTALFELRKQLLNLTMDESVEQYIVQLIIATREPQHYNEKLAQYIEYGASPRATLALDACARAHALLANKDYVSPDDVQAIAHDVLRHRLMLSYEAEANDISKDDVISELLRLVPVI